MLAEIDRPQARISPSSKRELAAALPERMMRAPAVDPGPDANTG